MKFLAVIGTTAAASILAAFIGMLARQDARGWPVTLVLYTVAAAMAFLLAGAVIAGLTYIFRKD